MTTRSNFEINHTTRALPRGFSCVLVGGTSLLIRCAEKLRERDHQLLCVMSDDSSVVRWAVELGIQTISSADTQRLLGLPKFDYLFSIVNQHILSPETLALPRKLAINYHDGPLPRYAGIHATSWALLNDERTHGVSWHLASKQVDAGDLLKQRVIEISANETAFTLNTKCYEAAFDSFVELIDDLTEGRSQPVSQDLSRRTFFPRSKKPPRAGMLLWDQPAEEIARVVRALDFGPHPNAFGSPKALINSVCFLIPQIEVLEASSAECPGTVITVDEDGLTVATATNDVAVKVATIEGRRLAKEALIAHEFAPGKRFEEIDDSSLSRLVEMATLCASHEDFWVQKLRDLQSLELPQRRQVLSQSKVCSSLSSSVPAEITLLDRQHENHLARPDFLLAAWAAYLQRIANADYFDLGLEECPLDSGFSSWRSFFAFLKPLRIEIDTSLTLDDFFISFQADLLSIRSHQTYLRDLPARYPEVGDVRSNRERLPVTVHVVESLDDSGELPGSELTLFIQKDGQKLRWAYARDAFESGDIERMACQFEVFLKGYAENPKCPIAKLPLMTEDELRRVLVEWNATNTVHSEYECIHQLIEAQVELSGKQPAVICEQEVVSYCELNNRANQLARYLRKLGVKRESLVGVCMPRSTSLIVGLLGILKAGGAYVPLDSSYPAERLAFIVEDTAVQVIVTTEQLQRKLPPHKAQVVCLDSDRLKIAGESTENLADQLTSDSLAYLIYTSGSTGRPKGVAIEHRSAVTLLEWAQTVFRHEELSGVLASTSICFDLSIFEIFVPLSCGGKVILAENALHLSSLAAADKVTLVNTVPSAMTELVRMNGLPSSVMTVNLAGEPLKPALVDQIYRQSNVTRVFDLYGPSEDTTYSTFALRQPGSKATIGRPIANTHVYILDKHLQPVPVGLPGELYLGGAGLARGYLNRPELTSERFIISPFTNSGARLYRTGDLARYMPDGNLEYLGRIDHQVKIRGFRIELGEIESVLNQHPSIRESIVIAYEDGSQTKNLAAYVVPHKGHIPTTLELREFLKEKLPQFMLPASILILDSLPLTPNGKLDRKALPSPASNAHVSRENFVAPTNRIEQELVRTWEEILKVQPVGVRDNFFELGGHSLLAVELFVRIEIMFGKKFSLATLFHAPTIHQLAELLQRENQDDPSLQSLVAIQPDGSKPPFFCIHARGGNVLFYRDLSKRLGSDQPFYGLQMVGLNGKRPYHTRIEEMAAHYIKEIRRVQPTGPYYLGGASFGGTAAYEIAQQLRANGEQVALLALFDTTGPGYPRLLPGTTKFRLRSNQLARSFQHRLNSLRLLSNTERMAYLKKLLSKTRVKTIRSVKKRLRTIAAKFPKKLRPLIFSPATVAPWALLEMEKAITQALNCYVTRPYSGHLTLFRASKQPLGIHPDPTLGWGDLVTGELEIHEIPGYHGAIVAEPYVRFLAEQLQSCIEEAEKHSSLERTSLPNKPITAILAIEPEHQVALQV